MLDELLLRDTNLFLYLNSLGNTTWDGFWLFMTNKLTTVPIYLLLTYILYKKVGAKQILVFILFTVLLITFSDQLANLFKHGFKRFRPCQEEAVKDILRLVKPYCGGRYGYYSAHAATGMALAIFYANTLKKYSWWIFFPLLNLALLVGYSRIYIGVHYPLDVFTGFVIGGVLGFLFYLIYTAFSKKFLRN